MPKLRGSKNIVILETQGESRPTRNVKRRKLRYSGDTNQFSNYTVKQLKEIAKEIGMKNISKLKTRFQLIEAIENVYH